MDMQHAVGCSSTAIHVSNKVQRCSCIVKLGGAAITDKAQLETLQPEVLSIVAAQLSRLYQERRRFVVVHGAGSFGHHQAKQYDVVQGWNSSPQARQGFALTRLSVTKLNALVVAALIQQGIPACAVSPFPTWTTCQRQFEPGSSHAEAVQQLLDAGLVPVLHGDAVLDSQLGCTILSGDTIVRYLAEHLQPCHVVFLTNVAGIYDRPPEDPGAKLVPDVTIKKAPSGTWEALAGRLPAQPAVEVGADATATQQQQQQPQAQATSPPAASNQDQLSGGSPSAPATGTAAGGPTAAAGGEEAAGTTAASAAEEAAASVLPLEDPAAAAGGPSSTPSPLCITSSAAAQDTTGGMAAKVQEAAAIAGMGIPVVVACAGSAAGAAACMAGPAGVQGLHAATVVWAAP